MVHSNSIKNQETKQKSLEKSIFENSKIAKEFLDKNNPITYIGDFILMCDKYLYPRWDNIVESLKTNKPLKAKTDKVNSGSAIYEKAKANKLSEQVQTFTRAMFGISVGPAMTLAKSFDFSNYTKLMDIGGGSGVYPIQIVKQQTNMNAVVLDLKPVCIVAEEYIQRFNLQNKILIIAFDLFKDNFPNDCDVALLSNFIHWLNKNQIVMLFKKIYKSLPRDHGTLLISEWLLNDDMTGPIPSAIMSMTMILEQTEGRNYSYLEISRMLIKAGFKRIEKRHLEGPVEVVIGYKGK